MRTTIIVYVKENLESAKAIDPDVAQLMLKCDEEIYIPVRV